jgi:hypothetical protein
LPSWQSFLARRESQAATQDAKYFHTYEKTSHLCALSPVVAQFRKVSTIDLISLA